MLTEWTPPVEAHARGLDSTTTLSCTARSWACPGGNIVELRVAGEIDRLTHPAVRAALDAALDGAVDQTSGHLVVDLSAVTFCCVRGFALLADTARVAASNGTGYALSGLPPQLARHAQMLWVADLAAIRCFRSAAVAVTAIRVEQSSARAR